MKDIKRVICGRIRTYNKITYTKRHGYRCLKNRILSFKPPTNLSQKSKQGMGYRVDLWKNGKPHSLLVARIIATTFLEDLINTKMTVNHKDGNRLNNKVDNLEWLSIADNIRYGFNNNQYPQKQTILYNGNTKLEFNSQAKASLFLGRNVGYINNCIKQSRNAKSKIDNLEYYIKINEK